MATIDLSRSATEFEKHYVSVRAQQGRVFVDDDHNENERLHGEDERRARIDIIGPIGSPDSGFLPSRLGAPTGKVDFEIHTGTLYLGGLRLEQETPETFREQSDWLQFNQAPAISWPYPVPQYDLVYIEAWQQPVSAVEDSELFEVALGGPDTSTRMRLMRRVHVFSDIKASDCIRAWRSLTDRWAGQGRGTLNDDGELVVDTLLTVGFASGGDPNDLCSPPVASGYLGAENQAIRVQLVDANHFTWGFDNAAPLYRVDLRPDSSGALTKIVMRTEPKDQAHWPLPGQVVELLPWSAVLSNNEKLAELSGFLATVDAPYDNVTKQFTITAAPSATFGNDWTQRSDAGTLATALEPPFFYLRVWSRGSDTLSPPAIPFTKNVAVALGNTGLTVTITGNDARPEDFWIIAARPESPDQVVPWLLESGRAPHGVRRFFAPLAVLEWKIGGGGRPMLLARVIDDCRKPFLPLTRIRSCCTYTVGDGVHSTGQFTSIQAAVDALPADGGEVCILPGVYTEAVTVSQRRNITIHGCCERTLVKAPQDSAGNGTAPVFTITYGSTNIRIEKLAVEAFGDQPGVLVPGWSNVANLALEELSVHAGPRTAIEIIDGHHVAITGCHIRMRPISGQWPGIYSGADDVLIKCNTVEVEPQFGMVLGIRGSDGIMYAWAAGRGGVHFGGGSERVRVIDNLIKDGIGNGITLGTLRHSWARGAYDVQFWVVNANETGGPALPASTFYTAGKIANAPTYNSTGALYDILIKDNRIYDMGINGIGVIAFFDLKEADEFITVNGLTIIGNDIRRCLQRPVDAIPPAMTDSMGYGGISLADVSDLVIRDNFIIDNGPSHIQPVCGIFVLHVEGADISNNQILNNGAKTAAPPSTAKSGARSGIEIKLALAPTVPVRITLPGVANNVLMPEQTGVPALTLHGNVVTQLGRALSVVALGPVSVLGNQFTSRGMIAKEASPTFAASTVMIFNLGLSNEVYGQIVAFALLGGIQPKATNTARVGATVTVPRAGLDDLRLGQRLANGKVMFNDNQCVLDLVETGATQSTCSILIASLDDVSFAANQCDCNLWDDYVYSQVILLATSVRATGNRLTEGVYNALLSATTLGLFMNNTTNNQATHCIYALGWPGWLQAAPNTILLAPLGYAGGARCGEYFPTNRGVL